MEENVKEAYLDENQAFLLSSLLHPLALRLAFGESLGYTEKRKAKRER
jgi:hypothetical protein